MKLTWYGHSAFGIETGDAKILIDPYPRRQSVMDQAVGKRRPRA